MDARIGTPIADLIGAAGGYAGTPRRLWFDGSMTGRALPDDGWPLTRAMNCIVAATDADLRLAMATALFKAGAFSIGRAARLAGVGVAAFVTHLSRLGIPVVQADPDEAASDLETLEKWLASSALPVSAL